MVVYIFEPFESSSIHATDRVTVRWGFVFLGNLQHCDQIYELEIIYEARLH